MWVAFFFLWMNIILLVKTLGLECLATALIVFIFSVVLIRHPRSTRNISLKLRISTRVTLLETKKQISELAADHKISVRPYLLQRSFENNMVSSRK